MIFHHPKVFHNFRTGVMTGEADEDCDIIVISFNGKLKLLEQFRDHIFTLSMQERRIFKEIVNEGRLMYDKDFGQNLIYKKEEPSAAELTPGAKQMIGNLLEQLLISLYRKQRECPPRYRRCLCSLWGRSTVPSGKSSCFWIRTCITTLPFRTFRGILI